MELTFDDIIAKHKNKPGIAMALGPSWRNDIKFVENFIKENDVVTFATGDVDIVFKNMGFDIVPDYWVLANNVSTVERRYVQINKFKPGTYVYAGTVDLTPNPDHLLDVDFINFDQRHFNGGSCSSKCCEKLKLWNKITIQEYLRNVTGNSVHYGTGDTSALHMLATAVLVGCNPIYLLGVDLDYSGGYVDGKTTNDETFSPYIDRILSDFKIINDSAKKIDIKIINCSQKSPINNIIETKTIADAFMSS